MNILIDIGHPAHVHLQRNVYRQLVADGHNVFVVAKPTRAIIDLLNLYDIPFTPVGGNRDSLWGKAWLQIRNFFYLWHFVRKHKIDIGVQGMTVAWVSRVTPMKSIILDDDDDEVESLFVKYAHPFADVILSPDCIKRKSRHTIYYAGTHELAYLYSNRFVPDNNVLKEADIKDGEKFFILRFNAFKAHHDIGAKGLSIEGKRKLVNLLQKHGRVFITTERNIDEEFRPYRLKVMPHKIHSLMYYATMLIGDSQTMTSEAAILGTPAIKCNSFAGRLSVPNEIEQQYNLCYSFLPEQEEEFFAKIDELLSMPNLKAEWQRRREKMLADKIDYAQFLTWFIENYPDSEKIMRDNPDYQWRFR